MIARMDCDIHESERANGNEENPSPPMPSEANEVTWEDGCTEEDDHYFMQQAQFAVRALYIVSRVLFPGLRLHDKLVINRLITELAARKPANLRAACSELDPKFLRIVLSILQHAPYIAVTVSTYCGIVVNEIEEFFSPRNSDEED